MRLMAALTQKLACESHLCAICIQIYFILCLDLGSNSLPQGVVPIEVSVMFRSLLLCLREGQP